MKKPTLFIGTSFLGAVKEGWDAIYGNGVDTFIGFNAPTLVANYETCWSIDNTELSISGIDFFVSSPSHAAVVSKSFSNAKRVNCFQADVAEFDCIVFVDMFHRITPCFSIDKSSAISYLDVPVSRAMLGNMLIKGFNGWMGLEDNKEWGNAPYINARGMIQAVRQATGRNNVILISAPRVPRRENDVAKRSVGINRAKSCFEFTEDFYETELGRIGVRYLRQPNEVLDSDRCFTDSQFSRGPHPTIPGVLDRHMNQAYGEIVARELVDLQLT